nr:immunoglobulin light chain junction region [Macaca mulatta]MOV34158.1 immunoglobulin light chain junction region [Macaca mulatta]MOV34173.1 immunoglobulin light chain junction region [Macaca mulatta]MOV34175.1 immunoglobulin light chain junction region [Macaca mulatta]MOV34236.1 immunoglobulin light chain junction region [Macaca mulatta]
CMQSTEFPFTF